MWSNRVYKWIKGSNEDIKSMMDGLLIVTRRSEIERIGTL